MGVEYTLIPMKIKCGLATHKLLVIGKGATPPLRPKESEYNVDFILRGDLYNLKVTTMKKFFITLSMVLGLSFAFPQIASADIEFYVIKQRVTNCTIIEMYEDGVLIGRMILNARGEIL